ncbi:expressed unknown protein [Seminavis robusta]|uniref:Uncharacterized protein n=1 Tax=Seminavis robusta TaxID=568900 RepID=A0A9N8EXQ1_9STRA|nr:expressed unknown protein [Seminavis robusta]|eukprot:Sro2012_g310910.1 n/a (110) ;mRNA; f:10348-10677
MMVNSIDLQKSNYFSLLTREMTYKITIPAVKINTGLAPPSLPLLPDDESLVSPEPCQSLEAGTVFKLEPNPDGSNTTAVSIPMPANTLTDEDENEAEFGEFLLDAVDWL